ncbi:MAG: hypothetical protein OEY59_03375 [Deltaproteobacteria bacterium]|nr:hypothetical protein [Deltaproteobacteria bacterium]
MAKKKKQKKAGIAKRQQNKNLKRKAIKRKIQSDKPVQQKMTMSKVKKSLKNIAQLVYEPELREIAFSKEDVATVDSRFEKTPEKIEALATSEFLEKFKAQLKGMEERLELEKNPDKLVMVQAVTYYVNQEQSLSFMNQVIVAMYLYAEAIYGGQEPPEKLEQLNLLLRDYDITWKDYLEERYRQLEASKVTEAEETLEGEAEAEEVMADTVFEKIEGELDVYLGEQKDLSDDAVERVKEDVQVLLDDYFEEKSIGKLEDLRPRRLSNFLENWFVQTMHPTRDDLAQMYDSLKIFIDFTHKAQKIEEDKISEFREILAKKESALENHS